MIYDSYYKTISSLDFTFERLTQFREEASTEGIYKTTPDLANKATRIVERAENDFERFDDMDYHGIKEHHVWSNPDPMLSKQLRTTVGGQQEILMLDQLRADTAQLSKMLGDMRSLRGRVCAMIAQYQGWDSELSGKNRLQGGEAQTADVVEKDVLPALQALLKRIDRVIEAFEFEERERLYEIQKVGNKVFIMRGGFTGRWARFNPALSNNDDKKGGGASGDKDDEEGAAATEAEPDVEAQGEVEMTQTQLGVEQPAVEQPAAAQAATAAGADDDDDTMADLEALDRGRMDERQKSTTTTTKKKKKKKSTTGKASGRKPAKKTTDEGDS